MVIIFQTMAVSYIRFMIFPSLGRALRNRFHVENVPQRFQGVCRLYKGTLLFRLGGLEWKAGAIRM